MRARQIAIILVAVLGITACNGGDDAVSTTPPTTTENVTAATTTTDATTSTSTTALPATPTTTAPTPSTAPTTTSTTTSAALLDDRVQAQLDVVEAVERADSASSIAQRDPNNDALLEGLADVYTGTLLEGFRNVLNRYRAENLRTIENFEVPDGIEVEPASVVVNESLTIGMLQACNVTSDVLVEVGGNADGTDRVVDDRIGRTVLEIEIVLVDGVWLVSDVLESSEGDRIASCD